MSVKAVFEGIQSIVEGTVLAPFNTLRALELESWFGANIVSWFFTVIGLVAFTYWMLQLKSFNNNNEEDRSQVSHSYLGDQ
jgi:hypothetical protein